MATRLSDFDCRRIGCAVTVVSGLIFVPALAFAQSATNVPAHVPLQKTIGQAAAAAGPAAYYAPPPAYGPACGYPPYPLCY